LVVLADLLRGGESVFARPAFDQPERMRPGFGYGFRRANHRGHRGPQRSSEARSVCGGGFLKFTEDRVDKGCGGAFAGALHQFDAFVECGARGDAVEKTELIEGQAESDQDFEIQLG
jgi:hypothetical protein